MEIENTLQEITERLKTLSSLQIENEMKLGRLADAQRETESRLQRFMETTERFALRVDNSMAQMVNILVSHEHRLDELDETRS